MLILEEMMRVLFFFHTMPHHTFITPHGKDSIYRQTTHVSLSVELLEIKASRYYL